MTETKTGTAEVGGEGKATRILRRGVAHTEATTHGVCVESRWLSIEPKGDDAHTAPHEGWMQLMQNVCFNKSLQKALCSGKTCGTDGAGGAPVSGVHVSCKKEGKTRGWRRSTNVSDIDTDSTTERSEPSEGHRGSSSGRAAHCSKLVSATVGDPEQVGGWQVEAHAPVAVPWWDGSQVATGTVVLARPPGVFLVRFQPGGGAALRGYQWC